MNGINRPGGKLPVPKLALIIIIVLFVGVIPLAVLIRSQRQGGNLEGQGPLVIQIPQKHNTDQEVIVSDNRTTLYVPEGTFDLTGSFVILPRQPNLFSYASDPEWSRPIVVDIEYRNEEGVPFPGITFSEPVSICFSLTQEQWKEFTQRPNDFQVQYFDDEESPFRWISLAMSMDPERNELCTETDHLSLYALAIRSVDMIPVTGASLTPFPTSIVVPSLTPFVFNTPQDRPDRDSDDGPVINPQQPTNPPPTIRPTNLPPTIQPTQPLPTQPPVITPPATDPPPTDPPPTDPPPTDPPPTDPPPTDPPTTDEPKPTKKPKPTKEPK